MSYRIKEVPHYLTKSIVTVAQSRRGLRSVGMSNLVPERSLAREAFVWLVLPPETVYHRIFTQ